MSGKMQQRRPDPCPFVPAWEEAVADNHDLPEHALKMTLGKPFPRRLAIALAFLLLLAWLPGRSLATDFLVERLARIGDPLEGIEGATCTWVYPGQVIDGDGNVMFLASFNDGEERAAYFYGQPQEYQLVMEWLAQAIGFEDPAIYYDAFGIPNLAEDGTISIIVNLDDDLPWTHSFQATYAGPADDLQLIYYEDGPAPGYPDGTLVIGFDYYNTLNARGDFADWMDVQLPDGTWIDTILAGPPDDLQIVAESGGPVPGIPDATYLPGQVPSVGGFTFNDLGWVGFPAWFEGPEIDETNGLGMFVGPVGDVQLVARTGSQAPGLDPGVTFTWFLWEYIPTNSLGNVAFLGYVQGPGIDATNDQGLWYGTRDKLELILREEEQAPGLEDGVVFDSLGGLVIHNGPNILVQGYLEGPGITTWNDEGQWYGTSQGFDLLIREGEQAPELDQGIVFSFDGDTLDDPWIFTNDPGDLLMFTALFGPGVTEENEVAVYYKQEHKQDWELVFRYGDQIDGLTTIANGDVGPWLRLGSGATGSPRSLNDDGMFVLYVEFEDDIIGIYRITPVPERHRVPDWDRDGDVDLVDFAGFQECFSSSSSECLELFDLDNNSKIDLEDFSLFMDSFTGPE